MSVNGPEDLEITPNAEIPSKKTLTERLKNAVNRKKLIAAGGLAGLATLAAAIGLNAAKDGGEKTENPTPSTPAERTIEPTTEPTQVVEITPTQVEKTPTPQPTEVSVPTHAPQETATPLGNWQVRVDYSEPSHFRTIEQDQAILNSVMNKFPHIGNVQIILTSGESSATYVDPDPTKPIVVYAGRDAYDFERKLHNEFARVFNVNQPEVRQRMQNYYSDEELQQLQELSQAVIEKWRNYPHIDKLFSPDKSGHSTINRFTAYPDAVFLQESIDLKVPGQEWHYPLSQPIFESNINRAEIEALANEIPDTQESYSNIQDFFKAEKAKLDQLHDPLHRLALSLIEEKLDYLKNWSWTSTQNLTLDTRYLRRYYQDILPKYEEIVLLCALGNNDPRLSQVFSEKDLQKKRSQYQILFEEANRELFETVYESDLMGEREALIDQYHAIINSPLHLQ